MYAKQVFLQADLPTHSQYLLEEKLVLLAGSKNRERGSESRFPAGEGGALAGSRVARRACARQGERRSIIKRPPSVGITGIPPILYFSLASGW